MTVTMMRNKSIILLLRATRFERIVAVRFFFFAGILYLRYTSQKRLPLEGPSNSFNQASANTIQFNTFPLNSLCPL